MQEIKHCMPIKPLVMYRPWTMHSILKQILTTFPGWWFLFWLVVPRGKFASTNQKHYLHLGSDASSVWISALVSQMSFRREISRASRNVGCFVRLVRQSYFQPAKQDPLLRRELYWYTAPSPPPITHPVYITQLLPVPYWRSSGSRSKNDYTITIPSSFWTRYSGSNFLPFP